MKSHSSPPDRQVRRPRAPRQIHLIQILNPFNPREFARDTLPWRRGLRLLDVFPHGTQAVVVSLNGKIVPPDQFKQTWLAVDDHLVLCPVPTGGGDGKSILALVAMIAIAIVAPEIALLMTGEWGVLGGIVSAEFLQAGIMLAGSALVHSVFAPSRPTVANAGKQSASYGIDGAKNTSVEGIPVPVCYGTFRMGGNILGVYTENDGDTQNLYLLLAAGEGPIAGISDIEINDNPVVDYKDIEIQTRLGLPNQLPVPWFNETVVAQNKGQKLTTDWFYHTTTTVVDKIRIDLLAPQGLCEIDSKSGESKLHAVDVELEYRAVASGPNGAWISFPAQNRIVGWRDVIGTFNGPPELHYDPLTGRAYRVVGEIIEFVDNPYFSWRDAANGTPVTDPVQLDYLMHNPPTVVPGWMDGDAATITNRIPVYADVLRLESDKRTAVRQSFSSPALASSKYEVRLRRIGEKSKEDTILDELYVSDINEIQLEALSYPNTAMLALKIRLGDQISGLPTVTFLHGGRLINVWGKPGAMTSTPQWYVTASNNPAWITWDILTHRRYGGAMPSSRLDFVAFQNWATYCDAVGLAFNGVLDSEMNVWDACQLVLRVGHAQLVNIGTRYTVVVEKAADPVMMFSVANMIEGSYKETWLSTVDRANEIDVTFFDKTDHYKQRTVKVIDPVALASGRPQRSAAITLLGVDNVDTAYREGQFMLNLNRYILKTIEFAAPMEALACTVGDLILVQHDVTDWAVAGRFEAGCTTTTLQLDRDVNMLAGKNYQVLVLFDAVPRASGKVLNVAGSSLFLSGYDGAGRVKRIEVAGRDWPVAGTFDQGNGWGVILQSGGDGATSLASPDRITIPIGSAYTLWDTDVIEEARVINRPGSGSTLTLQAPLRAAPAQFVHWMFGESDKIKQPFRIKAISGSADYRRDITAIEYRPEVYDTARYGDKPVIPPRAGVIGPVRALQVVEETWIAGEQIATRLIGTWQAPVSGLYAGADVYVARNNGALNKLAEVSSDISFTLGDVARGDVITLKVVAFDLFGKRSAFEAAPSVSYRVIGEISGIEVGSVTGATVVWSGRDCKIAWRYNAVTHAYEFGSEPSGADAGALDPQFKDYEVRVYDGAHKVLRRTEHVTSNSYTYIYDKNFADGLTRRLVFEIRMRDRFNNLGQPAILDAVNPPPEVTGVTTTATFESATVSYTHSNDPDFAGARVYLARNPADLDPLRDEFLVYAGPDLSVLLPNLMFDADYYVRVAPFDAFGPTELRPGSVVHFKTTHLNVAAIADGVLSASQLLPGLQSRIDLIDGPASVPGSVAARVLAEQNARASALLAEASARGAAISSESSARQTAVSSLSTRIDTVTAAVGQNAAAIQSETTARVTATGSLATQLNQLATRTDQNTAAISSETTARTDAVSALASNVAALASQTNGNAAAIVTESSTRAQADSAMARDIATLQTSSGDNRAAIANEVSARTSSVAALASTVTTLQTTLGGNTTALQTLATVTDGLKGQYSVKIDSNGYVAGFGLASYPKDDGTHTSEFMIRADTFGVVLPGTPSVKPFTIGNVNGVPRVVISNALIGDASIGNAKIGNAEINTLKIAGNAVTVPSYISGVGGASNLGPGSLVQVGQVILNFADTAEVVILANWQAAQPAGGGTNTLCQVRADASTVLHWSDSATDSLATSHMASAKARLGAGTHTFTVHFGNDWTVNAWDLWQWSVLILGVMR